jgi:predicted nuclease with TOPRIM domain
MNRSLAEEITEGFEALEKIRQLQADNTALKEYNTELHGIEHDLEMKVSKQQAEIDSLKDKLMLLKQSLDIITEWTKK